MRLQFLSKTFLEDEADRTRSSAYADGVSRDFPLRVDDVAEFHLGYDLFYGADLPRTVDGSTDPGAKLISVAGHITHDGRRCFTVAHEIGHIVLHLPRLTAQMNGQTPLFDLAQGPVQDAKLEFQANHFAAALLMPREVVYATFGPRARSEFVQADELADYFGVSVQAAQVRMRDLQLFLDTSPGPQLSF